MADKWVLHIEGPDDVYDAPSKEEAAAVAAAFNEYWTAHIAKRRAEIAAQGRDPSNYPETRAVVIPWTPEHGEHAVDAEAWADMAKYVPFVESIRAANQASQGDEE
ncbi:hypothetical protein [Pandoraea sp. SD6-2]|uniref:hypothetical protein n=1 Tax=Pandoraea sp. SD6-2 TaxID=1286093 RepID=UPI00032D9583|nr:hypothetical protein [Pandoraea sp. SD6-2]EON13441.1 hypothetical protein C266_11310 [Pandoraea sp. SD6-2]